MRNYISVNAKYYKLNEIDRIINHNLRQSRIDYLLPEEHRKFKNKDIIFNENLITTKENLPLENLDFTMRGQLSKLLEMKQDVLKETNGRRRKNENELIEMVVALSEEQALNYLNNGEDLGKGFEQFAKDIHAKYGLQPLAISLHLDEGHLKNGEPKFNIHGHLTFFNYHFEKQRSVLRTLQKKDFQDMQDLAANSFQSVGLNFQRGESKTITTKKHLERNEFILEKQKEELKAQILEINELKNEYKELLKTLEKGTSEYNDLYAKIGDLQQQEKDLRAKLNIKTQEINNFQDVVVKNKDIIDNLINNNITKNIVKQDVVIDIDKLKEDVNILVNKTLKIDIKSKELEEKDKVINDLKSKLEEKDKIIKDKDSVIEKVSTEKYQERSKNKTLEQDNLSKTNKLSQLEENYKLEIKKLKNDFKQQIARRVKRINLINRLKRSNIANKIRNRLSKRLNSNSSSNQRDR